MPRNAPPRRTTAGNLRARPATVPPVPIRLPSSCEPNRAGADSGLLAGLHRPPLPAAGCDEIAVTRRMDRGRISVPQIVEAAWIGPGEELDADVSCAGVVVLTPAARPRGKAIGTARAHTDAGGRIVITDSVRAHLGIVADADVWVLCSHPRQIVVASLAFVIQAVKRQRDIASPDPAGTSHFIA